MALSVQPIKGSFVGEVELPDLRQIDDATVVELRQAWNQYQILILRGLKMDEGAQVAFSQRFGDLEIHVRTEYLSREHPEILYVSNMKDETGRTIGILSDGEVGWHYDQIYLPGPAVGSFLVAHTLPKEGGATSFADMSLAYEKLPHATKEIIEGRKAVQSYEAFNSAYSVPTSGKQRKQTPDIEHPIVRTHPVTGRKALYICPGMTIAIVGLPEDESRALLDELFAWTVRPEFVYTHKWRAGDGVMWDNASTMHRREPFDVNEQRLMKRTTILPPAELAVPF
ncbi:MAG: TauD/TfdA family dioxygenase [Proteobacteria bacterium]|nr:TauD/TfdA family dioxygenase [Pseudomonadota bacterium]MDA1057572.1 TauD/TfdA family dioxygenase [Pseudomonadota bacterium]